jgi:CRISPR type III-B/RAMP module-associated protein Cmr5
MGKHIMTDTTNRKQSGRQTIEQQRAFQAWENIEELEQKKDVQGKYGSIVRGLPAMIQVNGLAGTLAFLRAKAGPERTKDYKEEYDLVYRHLETWMKDYFGPSAAPFNLMEWIRTSSMDQYRRATAEAIEYANWLKRYVEFKGWKSGEGD